MTILIGWAVFTVAMCLFVRGAFHKSGSIHHES